MRALEVEVEIRKLMLERDILKRGLRESVWNNQPATLGKFLGFSGNTRRGEGSMRGSITGKATELFDRASRNLNSPRRATPSLKAVAYINTSFGYYNRLN